MSCSESAKCNPNRPGRIAGTPLPACCFSEPQLRATTPSHSAAVVGALAVAVLLLACARSAIVGRRRQLVRALLRDATLRGLSSTRAVRLYAAALALPHGDLLRAQSTDAVRRWRRERNASALDGAARAFAVATREMQEEMAQLGALEEHVCSIASATQPQQLAIVHSAAPGDADVSANSSASAGVSGVSGATYAHSHTSSQLVECTLAYDALTLVGHAPSAAVLAVSPRDARVASRCAGDAGVGAEDNACSGGGNLVGNGGLRGDIGAEEGGTCDEPSFSASWAALRAHARTAAARVRHRARLVSEVAEVRPALEASLRVDSVANIRDELLHEQRYSAEDAATQATPIWAARREEWRRRAAAIDAELTQIDDAADAARARALSHEAVAMRFIAAAREQRARRLAAARDAARCAASGDENEDLRADARAEELALAWAVCIASVHATLCAWLACIALARPGALLAALPSVSALRPERCEAFEPWPAWSSVTSTSVGWFFSYLGLARAGEAEGAAGTYAAEMWRCVGRRAPHACALALVALRVCPETAVHGAAVALALRSLWSAMLAPSATARAALALWVGSHAAVCCSIWLGRVPLRRGPRLAFRVCWLACSACLTLQLVWTPPAARACSAELLGCGSCRACAVELVRHAIRGAGGTRGAGAGRGG